MKKYLTLILIGSLFIFACNNDGNEKNDKNFISPDSIVRNQNAELIIKDDIINQYIKSFNEIEDNLKKIKSKEKIITLHSKSSELQKSNKEQIISDIQYIYALLNINREALASMHKRFQEVNSKNAELQKFINNLNTQITEQESEIVFLKDKLNTLKAELDALNLAYSNEQKEWDLNSKKASLAYFAIGTFDGLKRQGLITKKGGVIDLGHVTELNPNIDKSMFSTIDINSTTEIPIAASKVKLITMHPTGSYNLEDTKLNIKKLIILNPDKFWGISKYLIIQVSNDKSPLSPEEIRKWPN